MFYQYIPEIRCNITYCNLIKLNPQNNVKFKQKHVSKSNMILLSSVIFISVRRTKGPVMFLSMN